MAKKLHTPKFQLQNVYADGSRDEPELYALNGIDAKCRMGRRGFLLTSAIGAGTLAALTLGCDSTPEKKAPLQNAPTLPQVSTQSVDGVAAHWPDSIYTLAFSPDGSLLAARMGNELVLRPLVPNEPPASPQVMLKSYGGAVAFSPNGKWLAVGADNYDVELVPKPFDKPALALKGHTSLVRRLAFSPDGRFLASASNDGVIYIWELQEQAPGARFYTALFDPDSTWSGTNFAQGALSGQGAYIVPCGSPLPAGAVCTCNCASGTVRDKPQRPSGGGGGSGGGGCQCNTICTCIPVK